MMSLVTEDIESHWEGSLTGCQVNQRVALIVVERNQSATTSGFSEPSSPAQPNSRSDSVSSSSDWLSTISPRLRFKHIAGWTEVSFSLISD